MSDAGGVAYIDTSALVKFVVREAESPAVEAEIRRWAGLATSAVTAVELSRAVSRARAAGRERAGDPADVASLLEAIAEVPFSARIRSVASSLQPVELRTLDAIHLASALELGAALGGVITYDARMIAAAASAGLNVISPT